MREPTKAGTKVKVETPGAGHSSGELRSRQGSAPRQRTARTALLAATFCAKNVFAQAWPTVALPVDAKAFGVGEQIVANGTPLRVQAFVSARSPDDLAAWFRQSLGKPLVENNIDNKLVLGRQVGEYYETVQLERSADGTRGLAAVTHLKGTQQNQAAARAGLGRWLARMPAGTKVMTDMTAQDGSKVSRYLVVVNTHTETLNRDRLISLMSDDGYPLEREAMAHGLTLFFKGVGKDAIATIHRRTDGRTSVVLNTVAQAERFN